MDKYSGVATGGQAVQLATTPTPHPTSDGTPREIDADQMRFSGQKNGGRFTGFSVTFYSSLTRRGTLHDCTCCHDSTDTEDTMQIYVTLSQAAGPF